jgi:hypothetical protein
VKAPRLVSIAVVVGLVAIYVAAKVHFFVRFGEIPLEGYLAEHSWLWAAALLLAWLGRLSGPAAER